jgi:preprotein translocase subunit SecY
VTRSLELAPYALAGQGFVLQTSLALIAGSFMIHQCANTITAAGVGNGSTLVICMGIITGAARAQDGACAACAQHVGRCTTAAPRLRCAN